MLNFFQKYRSSISLVLLTGYLSLFLTFLIHYHPIDLKFDLTLKQSNPEKLPGTSSVIYHNINSNCPIHIYFSSVHTATLTSSESNKKVNKYLILSLTKFEIFHLSDDFISFHLRAPPTV